jgi:hypothetical protein
MKHNVLALVTYALHAEMLMSVCSEHVNNLSDVLVCLIDSINLEKINQHEF